MAAVGNTGSGKTTLARTLATRLDVPHVELDALFWTIARIRSREEMWGTNRETVRDAFFNRNSLLLYAVKMHRKRRQRADVIGRYPHGRSGLRARPRRGSLRISPVIADDQHDLRKPTVTVTSRSPWRPW